VVSYESAQKVNHNNNINAFFLLVRAGLFGRTEGAESLLHAGVDWDEVHRLVKEQCVAGLIAEGMETLQRLAGSTGDSATDARLIPEVWALQFAYETLYLEKSNKLMNRFIADMISRMREREIYAILLKGQGVAQCYERPLWRTNGDVDLLLSRDDYGKAMDFLLPYASSQTEIPYKRHLCMAIGRWMVELHGSLRCGFSSRIDRELDKIYDETFQTGNVTTWMDKNVPVYMLGRENNVLYVFVHLLNHFYKRGVGIRQICDWCRLLWTYRDSLNLGVLESRLKSMGLMSEWRAFGAFAVEYLGIEEAAVPFYACDGKWKRKARRIQQFILKTGNMGHNRVNMEEESSLLSRKLKSTVQRFCDMSNHLTIFPLDTLRFMPSIFLNGLRHK